MQIIKYIIFYEMNYAIFYINEYKNIKIEIGIRAVFKKGEAPVIPVILGHK